jgi:hypothetical protein
MLWPALSQFFGRPLKRLQEVLTGNSWMIRIEIVLLQYSEDDLIEERLIGVSKTTPRV